MISHLFSHDSSVIGKDAWDSMREGMTCFGPRAMGDFKFEFEELCSKTKCTEAPNPSFDEPTISPEDMKKVREVLYSINQFFERFPDANR